MAIKIQSAFRLLLVFGPFANNFASQSKPTQLQPLQPPKI